MIKKKNFLLVFFLATAMVFTACSDDDDAGTPPVINPTGSLEVEDQTLMDGMLTVNNVVMSDDGWLVIYRDNAGAQGTEILGHTEVDAGTHSEVTVELDEEVDITDGETLWAALHVDDDNDGVFDWNGTTGSDFPVRSGVNNVASSFTVTVESEGESSVTAENQAVTDNSITISNVMIDGPGWIVVHADAEGSPGAVIGVSEALAAGSHDDVEITFDESAEVNVGDVLWIMLHSDTGEAGEYEFDGENGLDTPIMGDDGPVMTSITVTE